MQMLRYSSYRQLGGLMETLEVERFESFILTVWQRRQQNCELLFYKDSYKLPCISHDRITN